MDFITRTPGLQHIAEQIFSYLDRDSLLKCQEVNDHWGNILRKPWFWFNRMKQNTKLSQEEQKEWMNFCQKLSKSNLTKEMAPALNYIYEKLDDSVALNKTFCEAILNPNDPDPNGAGEPPIMKATGVNDVQAVRILAPLTIFPNAPWRGETPIAMAARISGRNYAEIIGKNFGTFIGKSECS